MTGAEVYPAGVYRAADGAIAAMARAVDSSWTVVTQCPTSASGQHAYCRRCLASYPGAHTAPGMAPDWAAGHVCQEIPSSAPVFGCSPIGEHVHELACLIDPADGIDRKRCVHCRASVVRAELGWCHEISGLYACKPGGHEPAEVAS